MTVDAEAVTSVRRLHKEWESQRLRGSGNVVYVSHHAMRCGAHPSRVGGVFHHRLWWIVENGVGARVRQLQSVQRVNHVYGGNVPVQIPFAQIHEDVVSLAGAFLELLVRRALVEEYMVDVVRGKNRAQVAAWVKMPIVDGRASVIRLQHTHLHDVTAGRPVDALARCACNRTASLMMHWTASLNDTFAYRRIAPIEV